MIVKRSVIVAGKKTSVSVEDIFWQHLKQEAKRRNTTLAALVAAIDDRFREPGQNLSSAVRCWLLAQNHARSTPWRLLG